MEGAKGLRFCGVVENVEYMGVFPEKCGRATVEMKLLGEAVEEVEGNGGRLVRY